MNRFFSILKFSISSLIGFLTDFGMFILLSIATQGMGSAGVPVSNIGARIVSATVNFNLNKKFVFKNRDSTVRTGIQYFALAVGILAGNTLLLTWLVEGLGWNRYLAKVLTEITFFSLSYLIQRFVIFRCRTEDPPGKEGSPYERQDSNRPDPGIRAGSQFSAFR
jgi:putative flippase GtrA